MPDKIILNFFITEEDVLRAGEHSDEYRPALKSNYRSFLWLLALPSIQFVRSMMCGCHTVVEAAKDAIVFSFFAIVVLVPFAFVFSFVLRKALAVHYDWEHKRALKKAARENHADRVPSTYVFDDEKIEMTYEGESDVLDWSGIDGVFEYPEGFLLLNADKQVELLIPKRAFETDFKKKMFRALSKRKFGEKASVDLFAS